MKSEQFLYFVATAQKILNFYLRSRIIACQSIGASRSGLEASEPINSIQRSLRAIPPSRLTDIAIAIPYYSKKKCRRHRDILSRGSSSF